MEMEFVLEFHQKDVSIVSIGKLKSKLQNVQEQNCK